MESHIKKITIITIMLLSGCSSNSDKITEPDVITKTSIQYVPVQKEYTPQLWSSHKVLNETPAQCANKGVGILTSLGFTSVIKNGDYVYGNFNKNRAAIKCVAIEKQTFVYFAVAGAKVKLVEELRNKISWKL
ncbi:hypothetical protein ACM9HF_16010 [Colwellia sp. RE-S-Sl-9]